MDVVTRVVALLLLLACAGGGLGDPVWCPDGCREAPAHPATSSNHPLAPGVCLFCGTGFIVTNPVLPSHEAALSPRDIVTTSESVAPPELHSIDPPPRLN